MDRIEEQIEKRIEKLGVDSRIEEVISALWFIAGFLALKAEIRWLAYWMFADAVFSSLAAIGLSIMGVSARSTLRQHRATRPWNSEEVKR